MKGAIELVSSTFLLVAGTVLLLIGIIMIVILFSQFKAEVKLHEHERAANQLAEAIVSMGCRKELVYGRAEEVLDPPSMLIENAVVNVSVLKELDNQSECMRFCSYGTGFKIIDKESGEEWYIGYKGTRGTTNTFAYPIAIWDGNELHEGSLLTYVYPEVLSLASCLADIAWSRGAASGELPEVKPTGMSSMSIEITGEVEKLEEGRVVLRNPANRTMGEEIMIFKCPNYATFCEVNFSQPILVGSRGCEIKEYYDVKYFTCEDALIKYPENVVTSINISSGTFVASIPCPYTCLDVSLCRLINGTCLPILCDYGCCCLSNATTYTQRSTPIDYVLFRTKLCGNVHYVITHRARSSGVVTERGCRMLYNARKIGYFVGGWSSEHARLVARRIGEMITFSIEAG